MSHTCVNTCKWNVDGPTTQLYRFFFIKTSAPMRLMTTHRLLNIVKKLIRFFYFSFFCSSSMNATVIKLSQKNVLLQGKPCDADVNYYRYQVCRQFVSFDTFKMRGTFSCDRIIDVFMSRLRPSVHVLLRAGCATPHVRVQFNEEK